MSVPVSSPRRLRQYAGLALVILVYLGGILGWTWAVQTVESPPAAPADTTAVVTPTADTPPVDRPGRIQGPDPR